MGGALVDPPAAGPDQSRSETGARFDADLPSLPWKHALLCRSPDLLANSALSCKDTLELTE